MLRIGGCWEDLSGPWAVGGARSLAWRLSCPAELAYMLPSSALGRLVLPPVMGVRLL